MKIRFEDAEQVIQELINMMPTDGVWRESNGFAISISDGEAAIYLPGAARTGECDLYVVI